MLARLLLLAFLLPLTPVDAVGPPPKAPVADPCRDYRGSEATTCDNPASCRRNERASLACEIRDHLLARYVLLDSKRRLLPSFDPVKHLNGCVQTEIDNEKENSFLAFSDRMRACIAAFKDTHLALRTQVPLPPVFVGIVLREIGGKFYISSRTPSYLTYVRDANKIEKLDQILAVGTEVLKIDGQSPADLKKSLMPYIAASSVPYAEIEAVEAIFERDFKYPTKNTVSIQVKGQARAIALPWWSPRGVTSHPAAKDYFRKLEITPSDRVTFTYDQHKHEWKHTTPGRDGFGDLQVILPYHQALRLTTYDDARNKSEAMRLGSGVLKGGKAFCYAQVMTFSPTKLVERGETVEQDFIAVLREFVKKCKEDEVPFVLDLRANGGGNGTYPPEVLSLLTEKGKTYQSTAYAFRNNRHTAMLIADRENPRTVPAKVENDNARLFEGSTLPREELERARSKKHLHSRVIFMPSVEADSDVDGYDQKVVLLVGPRCISACDMTAALFKRSGRGKLVGAATNGTGAGYLSSEALSSEWRDSGGSFAIETPNFLFGVPLTLPKGSVADFETEAPSTLLENVPITVDTAHATSLSDVMNTTKSWMDAVAAALR